MDVADGLGENVRELLAPLANRLANPTTGIVLNSWIDADRTIRGGAGAFVNQ